MKRLLPLLCVLAVPAFAEEPWSVGARHPVVRTASERPVPAGKASLAARVLRGLVRGYQLGISRFDGPHCPLYPTCSDYARQALARHGAFLGAAMTADRLMQEAEVLARSPRVLAYGRLRAFDPVSAEDFWWTRRPRYPLPLPANVRSPWGARWRE